MYKHFECHKDLPHILTILLAHVDHLCPIFYCNHQSTTKSRKKGGFFNMANTFIYIYIRYLFIASLMKVMITFFDGM